MKLRYQIIILVSIIQFIKLQASTTTVPATTKQQVVTSTPTVTHSSNDHSTTTKVVDIPSAVTKDTHAVTTDNHEASTDAHAETTVSHDTNDTHDDHHGSQSSGQGKYFPDEDKKEPAPFQLGQKFNYFEMGDDWGWTCASGKEQSPIDFPTLNDSCDNSMVMDIQIPPVEFQVEEHHKFYTLQSDGNFTNLYATDVHGNLYGYTAWQFHLHAPSEHSIKGKLYDLEMHIVHYIKPEFDAPQRKYAVLGILFEISEQNQPFFDAFQLGEKFEESIFNMSKLLGTQIPLEPKYHHYIGSLTTPPCSEVVNWYVLDTILPISQKQYNQFADRFANNPKFAGGNGNNRRVQPLNGRTIKRGGINCQEDFFYFFSIFIIYVLVNYFIVNLL